MAQPGDDKKIQIASPTTTTIYGMPSPSIYIKDRIPKSGLFGLPIARMTPDNTNLDKDDLVKYYYEEWKKESGEIRAPFRGYPKDEETNQFNDWLIEKHGFKFDGDKINKLPNARRLVNDYFLLDNNSNELDSDIPVITLPEDGFSSDTDPSQSNIVGDILAQDDNDLRNRAAAKSNAYEDMLNAPFPEGEEERVSDPGLEKLLEQNYQERNPIVKQPLDDLGKATRRGNFLMAGMALAELPVILQKRKEVPNIPTPEYTSPNIRSGSAAFKAAQGMSIDKQSKSTMDYLTRVGRPEAYNPADFLAAEAETNLAATNMDIEAINKESAMRSEASNQTMQTQQQALEKGLAMQAQYDAQLGQERSEGLRNIFNIGLSNISMHNKAAEIRMLGKQ